MIEQSLGIEEIDVVALIEPLGHWPTGVEVPRPALSTGPSPSLQRSQVQPRVNTALRARLFKGWLVLRGQTAAVDRGYRRCCWHRSRGDEVPASCINKTDQIIRINFLT